MLFLHIIIAISSLILTALTYIAPSRPKLRASYILTALTVVTGTYLIVLKPSHLVSSCLMGLAYLAITFYGIALAKNKLAKAEVTK